MEAKALGKIYHNGEVIVAQDDTGDCMYVVQEGQVEVVQKQGEIEVKLAVLGTGDFFGEMSLFEREVRSATVRSLGQTRVLTIDKRTFLTRVHEDPSLAYRILQIMSQRIRKLNEEYSRSTTFFYLAKPPGAA